MKKRIGGMFSWARLCRLICATIAVCICAGSGHAGAQKLDEEALYMQRYARAEAARTTRNFTDIYDTMVPLIGAESVTPLAKAHSHPFGEDTLARAIDYVERRNSTALLVVKSGKIVVEKYFQGTGPKTPLVAKSLAKPLSVIAVGRAIQEGHVAALDVPARMFLPEWVGTEKAGITLYHLLSMRSGFKRQSRYSGSEDVMRTAYLHPRHDEIIINDYPLTHMPGSRYDYSNANAEIIAPIIARATGKRYEDWVSDEVLRPLGAAGGTIWLNRPGGTAHSGCCNLLPAQSWVKLALLILQKGQWNSAALLSPEFVEAMITPTQQNPHVGMAVYNGRTYAEYRGATNPDLGGGTYHSEPYAAEDILLLDGNGNQVIYMIPSQDLIIARFGDTPTKELEWDNAFLPNLLGADISNAEQ